MLVLLLVIVTMLLLLILFNSVVYKVLGLSLIVLVRLLFLFFLLCPMVCSLSRGLFIAMPPSLSSYKIILQPNTPSYTNQTTRNRHTIFFHKLRMFQPKLLQPAQIKPKR